MISSKTEDSPGLTIFRSYPQHCFYSRGCMEETDGCRTNLSKCPSKSETLSGLRPTNTLKGQLYGYQYLLIVYFIKRRLIKHVEPTILTELHQIRLSVPCLFSLPINGSHRVRLPTRRPFQTRISIELSSGPVSKTNVLSRTLRDVCLLDISLSHFSFFCRVLISPMVSRINSSLLFLSSPISQYSSRHDSGICDHFTSGGFFSNGDYNLR